MAIKIPLVITSGQIRELAAGDTIGGTTVEVDSQQANLSTSITTSSTTYVDIPGMTLTTSNSVSRKYLVLLNVQSSNSNDSRSISVKLVVDGVDLAGTERTFMRRHSGESALTVTYGLTGTLATGKIIKAQWKTSASTETMTERTLIIYSV